MVIGMCATCCRTVHLTSPHLISQRDDFPQLVESVDFWNLGALDYIQFTSLGMIVNGYSAVGGFRVADYSLCSAGISNLFCVLLGWLVFVFIF